MQGTLITESLGEKKWQVNKGRLGRLGCSFVQRHLGIYYASAIFKDDLMFAVVTCTCCGSRLKFIDHGSHEWPIWTQRNTDEHHLMPPKMGVGHHKKTMTTTSSSLWPIFSLVFPWNDSSNPRFKTLLPLCWIEEWQKHWTELASLQGLEKARPSCSHLDRHLASVGEVLRFHGSIDLVGSCEFKTCDDSEFP